MGPLLLEARGITVDPLRDVSLAVHAGEFVAILGPLGPGRSGLLRVLGLREAPASGALFWHGRLVTPLPPGPELAAQRRLELFLTRGPANAPPSLRLLRLLYSLHQRGQAIILATEYPEAALWSQTIYRIVDTRLEPMVPHL